MLNRSSAGVFRHLPLLNWQFFGMVTAALLSAVTPAMASEAMASERLRSEPLDEVSSGSVPVVDETPTISDSDIHSGSLLAEVSAPSTDAQPEPTLANGADPVIAQVQTGLSSADAVETAPEAVSVMGFGDLEAALETEAVVQPLPSDDLAQVTRVTDFSDVAPSDWAFQALNNLVENYGCMQGYPDSTFRGQRSLTRFEFAAGLNACLDVIVSTINTDISEADLAALRRLQEEFAAELAALTSRVDQLEADTAELTAQQFSTVTKLRGQVFLNLSTGFANGDVLAEGNNVFSAARGPGGEPVVRTITRNPALTVGSLLWLNFDTSFTGSDLLKLQLVSGAGVGPANTFASAGLFNTYGTPFLFQSGVPGGQDFNVVVREFSYVFPVGNSLRFDIGPRINWYAYFDQNRYTFFLNGANSFNSSGGTQVNAVDRGTGAIGVWNVADWLDIRVGYLAEDTEFIGGQKAPTDPNVGLFGGTSTITGQIGLKPFDGFNLRLLYTRSNLMPNNSGQIGGTFGEPIYGFADDGFGGPLTNAPANTFLVNFDWTPLEWLGLFGRYSYGNVGLTSAINGADVGSVDSQSFQLGVAFPNLFAEGAQGTISYLVPFSVISGREFLVSGGGDGGRQQEVEFAYRLPINRNIYLMPSVYWIMQPNNFSSNPDIFIFNLQTQFLF
jgi:hypothetical protein